MVAFDKLSVVSAIIWAEAKSLTQTAAEREKNIIATISSIRNRLKRELLL